MLKNYLLILKFFNIYIYILQIIFIAFRNDNLVSNPKIKKPKLMVLINN